MSAILRHINTLGWHRILAGFLLIWLIILFFTAFPLLGTHINSTIDMKTSEKLTRALADLEALKKQNYELQEIFKEINLDGLNGDQKEAIENFQYRLTKVEHYSSHSDNNNNNNDNNQQLGYISMKDEPNTEYELLRRRIFTNIKEFWYFINSNLLDLQKKSQDISPELTDSIQTILNLGIEFKRSLIHDIKQLEDVDGYLNWRETESNELSSLVQKRFHYLQNPDDCKTAKKLVCSLNKGCGYGCQLHHVVYCFMVAYGTKRTLILKSKGWRYHKSGWEDVFQPISDTCLDPNGETTSNWPGNQDTQVINLPIIDSLSPRPPFLPLSIPEDLSKRLIRLHGDPIVWWVGQILKYLLRPQTKTASLLKDTMLNMGFKHPIVGVHVRRTDKVGTEAAYHGIEEYMQAVDEYYNEIELYQTVDKRRVYLASDDPKVITDAINKYPQYEIIGDPMISKTAAVSTRYSDSSLFGIINDIHMLSLCDFLVCTFSSQVCRVAYELMQNNFPDASWRYRSLDDIYYYGGQNAHNMIAVLPHEPKRNGEMNLQIGDVIGVAGNHWNGFSKGRNLRTNQIGLYPGFKVKDKIETAKFPTYSEIDNKNN